jgi:hypothetical protein
VGCDWIRCDGFSEEARGVNSSVITVDEGGTVTDIRDVRIITTRLET